jgi:hypothetical protein
MNRSSDLHRAFEVAPVEGGIQRHAFDSKPCRIGSGGAVKRTGVCTAEVSGSNPLSSASMTAKS